MSVATLGFDSAVSARAARGLSFLRGRAVYVAAMILTLASFRSPVVDIRGASHTFRGPILLVATANTPMYGGGLQIAPGARPDDGMFRVCLIQEVARLTVLRLLPLVMSGRHTRHPAVQMWDTPYLEVQADPPSVLYADGEPLGRTPIRLEILPRSLQVIVPAPPSNS
jgi:diacylglycerol kinase (ATP)